MKRKPKNLKTLLDPRTARKRQQVRLRTKAYEQRIRDAKKHPLARERFYLVPMLDSEINRLVADLKVKDADKPISAREWAKIVGLAIAAAAKSALRK
jgi:hypothetical protein